VPSSNFKFDSLSSSATPSTTAGTIDNNFLSLEFSMARILLGHQHKNREAGPQPQVETLSARLLTTCAFFVQTVMMLVSFHK